MKDVVRLVAVILVCQLPPDPKTETEPARDFGRKHQRINGGDDDDNDADNDADDDYDHQHYNHTDLSEENSGQIF